MKCNNCGREISDTSNFCVYCGTQVANQRYAQNSAAMGNMPAANQQNVQNTATTGNISLS